VTDAELRWLISGDPSDPSQWLAELLRRPWWHDLIEQLDEFFVVAVLVLKPPDVAWHLGAIATVETLRRSRAPSLTEALYLLGSCAFVVSV